jgi:hypothetical protein
MNRNFMQYIGPQSHWNQHAVNRREKYYYGYGGYLGCLAQDKNAYRELIPKGVSCNRLTEDCWNRPQQMQTGLPESICIEMFEDSPAKNTMCFLGLMGGVALAFYLASSRK